MATLKKNENVNRSPQGIEAKFVDGHTYKEVVASQDKGEHNMPFLRNEVTNDTNRKATEETRKRPL